MPSKLENIVAATRQRVAVAKASADIPALTAAAERHQPRGFRQGLQRAAESGVAVIAELKKASPSKGLIRADFDVATTGCRIGRSRGGCAIGVDR